MHSKFRSALPTHVVPAAIRSALLVAVLLTAARADDNPRAKSLAGLAAVHLHLAVQGEDLAGVNLTEPVLRADIEQRLRDGGLRLLTFEESSREPGVPWLAVYVTVLKSSDWRTRAFMIRIELEQRACLERNPAQCSSVVTWSSAQIGTVGRRKTKSVNEDVYAAVDEFLAAYHSAQPH